MQEVGYALPAAAGSRNNGVVRKARLTKRLDQESGFLQRYEIGLQRTMLAIERHRQAVALDRIGVMESMKIVAFDDEVPVGGLFFEASSRVDRLLSGQLSISGEGVHQSHLRTRRSPVRRRSLVNSVQSWLPAIVVLAGLAVPPAAGAREVRFYNWSNYMAPGVLDDFTRETGIKVTYDTFDSNETLETKLLAGKSGYDLVVSSGFFLERQIKAGVFQKLDKSRLSNLDNVWPEVSRRLEIFDPGNRYAVNYMWGTTGIGYNFEAVQAVLGPDARADDVFNSWDVVFNPEKLARFRDCGIEILDSADDILTAALAWLGIDPNSTRPEDLEKAANAAAKLRPLVRKFHSSEYLNALATGEICVAVGWSGDVKQAQKRAEEAKRGIRIRYRIPTEGAPMFFDNLAIPADAGNVAEAHELINYLYRPEIMARNSDFLFYANGNLASQRLIDPEIIHDNAIYPDDATLRRLFTIPTRDLATTRIINRLWTRVKTGR